MSMLENIHGVIRHEQQPRNNKKLYQSESVVIPDAQGISFSLLSVHEATQSLRVGAYAVIEVDLSVLTADMAVQKKVYNGVAHYVLNSLGLPPILPLKQYVDVTDTIVVNPTPYCFFVDGQRFPILSLTPGITGSSKDRVNIQN